MSYLHGPELVTAAKKYVGRRAYSGMCQAFSILVSKTGTGTPDFDGDGDHDAVDWWKHAKKHGKVVEAKNIKHLSDVPAGTIAYWTGGSRGYGHAAPTIGDGKIVSTDAPKWGTIGIVTIDWIARNWGNGLTFVGYIVDDGYGHRMVDQDVNVSAFHERVDTYVVTTKAAPLNGREGPGTSFKVVSSLPKGGTFVSAGWRTVDGALWIQRASDKHWFAGEYLDLVKAAQHPDKATERIVLCNAAGYNKTEAPTTKATQAAGIAGKTGMESADARIGPIADKVTSYRPDVIAFTELSEPMLEQMDAAIGSEFVRALLPGKSKTSANGKGREVYLRADEFDIVDVRLGDVTHKLNGDSKPLLGVVYEPKGGGARRQMTVFQSENQDGIDKTSKLDADTIRKYQLREALVFAIDHANAFDVPYYNVTAAGDGNSYTWAREVAEAMNWKDAGHDAPTKQNAQYKTHNNWKAPLEGEHFDLTLVRHYVELVKWAQFLSSVLADHHITITDRKVLT